ncbi:MAG TPA: glycosyltransferase family 2 protein [Candidatus Angelobacter sp.]|nr:glycosyltransferase family 2 protein [Candidatus Angelobacter sp.]
MSSEAPQLDIVIPVYNEGGNILRTLQGLTDHVQARYRVLICYDFEEDDTLSAVREHGGLANLEFVKNRGRGAHQAIMTGFQYSHAPFVLVYPADDDYNAAIIDAMLQRAQQGNDIVCASRFIPGGSMVGCPWLKAVLVRGSAFTLYHFARIPTRDSSNGFRMFSRRLLERVRIESTQGFTYSIELLAKCHRLRWAMAEVPAQWRERTQGQSRFRVVRWVPAYLRWYFYVFATTFLRRPPESVSAPIASPAGPAGSSKQQARL